MSLANRLNQIIDEQKISKRERLSNWEADVLTEKQQVYAATDAWACIVLYEEIIRLESARDYDLVVVPEESKPAQAESTAKAPSRTTPKRKTNRSLVEHRKTVTTGKKSRA